MTGENENQALPPKRFRWYQWSLRTLFIVVALVGVLLATLYRRSRIDRDNVTSMQRVAQVAKNGLVFIAWSPDRHKMAVVTWEKEVEVRDAVTLELLEKIGDGKRIIGFAFSPVEGVVAFCENSKIAMILDRRSGKSLVLSTGNPQPTVVFSPDGSILATGGYGDSAQLWRTSDGTRVHTLNVGVVGGLTPVFSPDGKIVAIGNRCAPTCLFDTATGQRLCVLPRGQSHGLKFHPEGHTLAIGYADGGVALWRVHDGKLLAERTGFAEEIYTLDWSSDGALLATAGLHGKMTFWNPQDLSLIHEFPAPEWVHSLQFSPDGLNLAVAGGSRMAGGERQVEVWGVEGKLFSLVNRRKPAE